MKAESSIAASRPSRNNVYARPAPKRTSSAVHPLRPIQSTAASPNATGVQKSRSKAALASPRKINPTPLSPSTRAALELQRQRQQQVIALEREARGLLEEEYRHDVISYLHHVESSTMSSLAYMDMQPEIQWHMRACLVEFLIEVHLNFRLRPETLYLTCNIVDRYVSRRVVYKKHYQLVGCAALWIAAKFEDAKERVPTVRDLCEICRDEYDESAFIQMEGHVLATIAWRVGHPTAEAWLRIACVGLCFEDNRTQHVARFLMEITLFHREYIQFTPSVVAKAALLLARYTLGKSRRPFEETEPVIAVVQLLDSQLAEHLDQLSQMLVKKYSFSYYSKASTHIVQYYLQGYRYQFIPIAVSPISSRPTPRTPTHKITPRVVQAWPSASSSTSDTPSFSNSDDSYTDFSSEADDILPRTPPPLSPSFSYYANLTHVGLEPLSLNSGSTNPVALHAGYTANVSATSSNKENQPVIVDSTMAGSGVHGPGTQIVVVNEGPRSRKSSLELVQQNANGMAVVLDASSMEMCQPSPASREATYIPRAALHSLASNGATVI